MALCPGRDTCSGLVRDFCFCIARWPGCDYCSVLVRPDRAAVRNAKETGLVSFGMQHELLAIRDRARGASCSDTPGDDLLTRARSGDREALNKLCRENWLPVYRAVMRWARTPAEAEDLTQEVFLRAIRALDNYRDPGIPYRAYLLRVARNLGIDKWRARQGRPADVVDSRLQDQPDPGPGPEATAIATDERRRLIAALDRLPDDYSDVLRLRIMLGRTAAEVGELRGLTANAVRQLQFRAIAALRKELAAQNGADL